MSSRSLIILLLMLLSPVLAMAAESKLRALHIEGAPSAKALWYIEVRQQDDTAGLWHSLIYRRGEGEPAWNLVTTLPAQVKQVTRYGNELVALLSGGEWIIIGQGSGRRLPARGRIIALAGGDDDLFAIGEQAPPATQPASTQPSQVEATTTTTSPTTQPLTRALYQLVQGIWQVKANLPEGVAADQLALGIIKGAPTIAALQNTTVSLWQFTSEAKWALLGSVEAPNKRPAKIFEEAGHTFIYLSAQGSPSELLIRNSDWLAPISLPATSDIRAIGFGGGQIRFVFADQDSIKERRISPRELKVQGADTAMELPELAAVDRVRGYVHWVMMAIIALVMLHTYRKREEYQHVTLDWTKLQLAPFGRRFVAGIIDMAPVILALLYARVNVPGVLTPTDVVQSASASELVAAGVVIFLAHTTITEAIAGRSVGKMLTHLQVLRLDGKRPGILALVIRNILRVVDLVLVFTLILMVYLPLRQRLGDLAAGTVVVMDKPKDAPSHPDA